MKLAISNIAWGKSNDCYVYDLMKKYGFEGLEIAPTRFFEEEPYDADNESLDKILTKLDRYKITIVSMQSLLFGKPDYKLFGNKTERENLKNYLKKAMNFAYKLKIKNFDKTVSQ